MDNTLLRLGRRLDWRLALTVPLVLALAGPVFGSTVAFQFDSAPTSTEPTKPLVIGFQFSTNQNMTVSSLGYYDDGGDGFLNSHQIGIFNSVGTLVASATVSAGTGDALNGNFRYVDISPVLLPHSQTFTIAATAGNSNDAWAYGTIGGTLVGLTVDPAINIASTAGRFSYPADGALYYPTDSYIYSIYAGPDFQFDVIPIPEPGTFGLLGLAMAPVLLLSRSSRFRRFAARLR